MYNFCETDMSYPNSSGLGHKGYVTHCVTTNHEIHMGKIIERKPGIPIIALSLDTSSVWYIENMCITVFTMSSNMPICCK